MKWYSIVSRYLLAVLVFALIGCTEETEQPPRLTEQELSDPQPYRIVGVISGGIPLRRLEYKTGDIFESVLVLNSAMIFESMMSTKENENMLYEFSGRHETRGKLLAYLDSLYNQRKLHFEYLDRRNDSILGKDTFFVPNQIQTIEGY